MMQQPDRPRRVAMLLQGSRGDFQPFISLALELRKRGAQARHAASPPGPPAVAACSPSCVSRWQVRIYAPAEFDKYAKPFLAGEEKKRLSVTPLSAPAGIDMLRGGSENKGRVSPANSPSGDRRSSTKMFGDRRSSTKSERRTSTANVKPSSVDFFGLPNMQYESTFSKDPTLRDAMARGDFWTFLRAFNRDEYVQDILDDACIVFDDAHKFRPDVMVFNPLAGATGLTIAQALDVPTVMITMQMIGAISGIEAPFIIKPSTAKYMPAWMIRITWHIFLIFTYHSAAFSRMDKLFRQKKLGMPRISYAEFKMLMEGRFPKSALMIARSPLGSPPPRDWPKDIVDAMVGNFVLSAEDQVRVWPPPPELLTFLARHG